MPRRIRGRGRSHRLTRDVLIASLHIDFWREYWGSHSAASAAWAALAPTFPHHPGERPEPWWSYTPGVPDELRVLPRDMVEGAAPGLAAFEARRQRWLFESEHATASEMQQVASWRRA
jgi:hypothetical protein